MKPMGPVPADFAADDAGRLCVGGRSLEQLVAEAGGTPAFIYDRSAIARRVASFKSAMPREVALHYAVKANPYRPLLEYLAKLVDGFDVASAGELGRVADLGLPVSFAGPGKRDSDLETAVRARVTINLESEGEAERLLALCAREGLKPRVAVRINPPFALKGAGMKMGGLASPFGLDWDRAPALIRRLVAAGADWRGLHLFSGSQSLDAAAIGEAQAATVALAASIAGEAGQAPAEVNLGGGLGIPYFAGDRPIDIETVGEALRKTLENRPKILADTRFAVELGRWLVGEAGIYATRIVDRKTSRGRTFLVTDGGLHHILAASGNFGQLLRRNYPLAVAGKFAAAAEEEVTITGCLCTPLDLIGDAVALPRADVGDLIAVFCTGAYGLSASPQEFLGHPRAREQLA